MAAGALRIVILAFLLSVLASFAEAQDSEPRTVVVRTVGTSPSWGQEPVPGWPTASPVKRSDAYVLYDLEIGRNAANSVEYFALLQLDNDSYAPGMSAAAWTTARGAHEVARIELSDSGLTPYEAVEAMFDAVFDAETPDRFVLSYSGHGGPSTFFEGAITIAEGADLVAHVRKRLGFAPFILDFSTNCNVGFLEFIRYFDEHADYLIASEHLVGGWGVDSDEAFNAFYRPYIHSGHMDAFFASDRPLGEAFELVLDYREEFWRAGEANMAAGEVEQSLAVYDLRRARDFFDALAARDDLSASVIHEANDDLGTFVYESADADLINAFEALRIDYRSNKSFFEWNSPTEGLGLWNYAVLEEELAALAAPMSTPLLAATLPDSRSVRTGGVATAFASIFNNGDTPLQACAPQPSNRSMAPAGFSYQTTDPATNALTGTPATPVDIAPGATQSFVISAPALSAFNDIELEIDYVCKDTAPAPSIAGVNTLAMNASDSEAADLIMVAVTPSGDGIASLPASGEYGFFTTAVINIGDQEEITFSLDAPQSAPVLVEICQTNPVDGVCLGTPGQSVQTVLAQNETAFFSVFLRATAPVAFDPANNRLRFQGRALNGGLRGATSTAVRTQ